MPNSRVFATVCLVCCSAFAALVGPAVAQDTPVPAAGLPAPRSWAKAGALAAARAAIRRPLAAILVRVFMGSPFLSVECNVASPTSGEQAGDFQGSSMACKEMPAGCALAVKPSKEGQTGLPFAIAQGTNWLWAQRRTVCAVGACGPLGSATLVAVSGGQ